MDAEILRFELNEETVFLFIPPSVEKQVDLLDDILDDITSLIRMSPSQLQASIKNN